MKVIKFFMVVLTLAGGFECHAQFYQLNFVGSCATKDQTGRIVSVPLTTTSLLRDYAQNAGITNSSGLLLAYHLQGNDLGDTIEVINRTNGMTLAVLFGLYFGEAFDRSALISNSGQQIRRIEYVYTDQNSHSVGSALLTTYYWFDSNGNTNATYTGGQMQYLVLPVGSIPTTQVCNATFGFASIHEIQFPWR